MSVTYPKIEIGSPLVFVGNTPAQLERFLGKLHKEPFAETVNAEITRLEGYYRAVTDWLNNANKAHAIAKRLNLSEDEYNAFAKEYHYLSNHILASLRQKAGMDTSAWEDEAQQVNVKNIARQRMLMMQSILHSVPVIMRDPFNGAKAKAEYGFVDGKAKYGNVRFSAVASPRLHDFVFRFAVCQNDKDGFTDNNPAMILDNAVVDAIEDWDGKDSLYKSMALNLYPNIHDWGHSWLLYDVRAKSNSFKQWGADIFFNVEHLIKNKLVINYELLLMTLHRYVWKTMIDAAPAKKQELVTNLQNYNAILQEMPASDEMKEYLFYVVASNLCFVLDPKEPEFAALLNQYPAAKAKLEKTLGTTLDRLHNDITGIPSQAASGSDENLDYYVNRYPMEAEIKAGLKAERLQGKSGEKVTLPNGARIYTENMAQFEALPTQIQDQVKNIRDSDTYGILNKALARVPESRRQNFIDRIRLDDDGRMFFKVDRAEIDLSQKTKVLQNKKVVLVEIPKGGSVELHPRISVSLVDEVKRQKTKATDIDVVAFNVADEEAATQILAEKTIGAKIKKAKELGSAIDGADDIYPLRRAKAEQIYGFNGTGFYESKNRVRYATKVAGPMIMNLQDGSDQKVFNGVAIYIPFANDEQNPDIHFAESKDFKRTHKAGGAMRKLKLKDHPECLDRFLGELDKINRIIDFGSNYEQTKGLFT